MSRFHKTEFDFYPEHAFKPVGGRMTLEGGGGGGSSAPPPDPALVAAQIKSLGIQDKSIEQIMRITDQMMPTMMEQQQFGLSTAKTSFQQAQADREWSLGKRASLDSMQQPLIDEAKNFDEGARRSQMMDEADADITASFNAAQQQQQRGLQRRGINPNSMKALDAGNQASLAQATARASVGAKISQAAKAEGLALKSNAVNMLSGYPAMASANTGSGFGFGTAGIGLANQSMAGMTSGFNQAGTMAGQMGSNATNMWNAQANYKAQQDANANKGSDMFGSILGLAAGAGATAFMGPMGGAAAAKFLK
jgi:hypothetical protein